MTPDDGLEGELRGCLYFTGMISAVNVNESNG
jgi:hypothetical protein